MSARKKNVAKGSGVRGFYILLGVVALLGVAAIGYAIRGGAGSAATEPIVVPGLDDPGALLARADGISIGNTDAPVTMIIFSDYQCPACMQFASRMKPVLEANEVQAGTLRMVYYDLPLTSIHQHAFLAARAARCAGDQGKYWEFHEQLFQQQADWAYQRNTPISKFKEYATSAGLDQAAFTSCLQSDRFADTVSANVMLATQLGIMETPSVIINGRRLNPFDYDEISALIAAEAGS